MRSIAFTQSVYLSIFGHQMPISVSLLSFNLAYKEWLPLLFVVLLIGLGYQWEDEIILQLFYSSIFHEEDRAQSSFHARPLSQPQTPMIFVFHIRLSSMSISPCKGVGSRPYRWVSEVLCPIRSVCIQRSVTLVLRECFCSLSTWAITKSVFLALT